MKIYLGSDHRGFHLKEKIAKWLFEWGYGFTDLGAETYDEKDDYTKYATEVALMVGQVRVSVRESEERRGILLCGSGVGVDVTANKFDGVRASIGIDAEQVRSGRKDDDMNILVIAAEHTEDHLTREMVKSFLETKFDGKPRHRRRLEEIAKIEKNN